MMNIPQTKMALEDVNGFIASIEFKIKLYSSRGMDHSVIGSYQQCLRELEATREELECDLINLQEKE